MELTEKEVNSLIDLLFYTLAACTASKNISKMKERGQSVPDDFQKVRDALHDVVPMQAASVIADLIRLKGSHDTCTGERMMLYMWLNHAKAHYEEHEDDEQLNNIAR